MNRINEFAILTSKELMDYINNRGYELVGYDILLDNE
jgi:predicted glycoside hydrolase/deacetylase ChbG (UPF0249 family)